MRRFYITLVLAFLSTLVCTRALAYDAKIDGVFYSLNSYSKTATVTYETTSYNSYSGEVSIPETVTYDEKTYTVTTIGWGAFMDSKNLTKVVLPETVTTIENYAFQNSGLVDIVIPSGLINVGSLPFQGTPWLDNQPEGLLYIGNVAYSYIGTMPEGTEIALKEGTVSLAGRVFANQKGLKSISIPSSVRVIGTEAFRDCSSLSEIVLPEGVTTIGELVWFGCTGLSSFHLPASVTDIKPIPFGGVKMLSLTVDPANPVYDSRDNCNAIIRTSSNQLVAGCCNTVIPEGVTSLAYGAFDDCLGLETVNLPSSVKEIGFYAFSSCPDLVSITVSPANPVFDSRDNCNAIIKTATNELVVGCKGSSIPNSVTSIGSIAFYSCGGLKSIVIPGNVKSIESNAFAYCVNLSNLTLHEGISNIGSGAFYVCYNLNAVVVPHSVEVIESNAFLFVHNVFYTGSATGSPWGANNVYATVPDENGFLFSDDTKTKLVAYVGEGGDVVIPDGVMTIDRYAFKNCSGINTITVPTSVTFIGEDAFLDVPEVTYFGSASGSPWGALSVISSNEASMDDFEFADEGKTIISKYIGAGGDVVIPADKGIVAIGDGAFKSCKTVTSVVVPEGVMTIGKEGFYECEAMEKITLPSRMSSLGTYAFAYCRKLKRLVIPEGVTCIEPNLFCISSQLEEVILPSTMKVICTGSFQYCSSLKKIDLPEGLETIEDWAFAWCSRLEQFTLPASVVSNFDGYALFRCVGLTKLDVAPGNPRYDCRENCNGIIETATNTLVAGCFTTVIPTSVTAIGDNAYHGHTEIKEFTIPEWITSIGYHAFWMCEMKDLFIPASVTKIKEAAFDCPQLENITVAEDNPVYDSRNNCNAIIETATNTLVRGDKNTVIPEEITTIGQCAFTWCKMETMDIPAGVTVIADSAFGWCQQLKKIEIPEGVTYLGRFAIGQCDALTEVVVPDAVKAFGDNMFYYCDNLKSVTIGNGVPAILRWTFSYCSKLETITLGYRVDSIGANVFSYVNNLKALYMNSPVPPKCDARALNGFSKETCVLYVPEGSLAAYKEADQWKEFAHIEVNPNAPTPYYDVTYVVDGEVIKTDVVAYGETITLLEDPTKEGLYFSGWSGYPEDMIMPAHDITVTGTFSTTSLAIINTSHASDKKTYDMFGREVKTMQGGQLYLRGGKKMMVRP